MAWNEPAAVTFGKEAFGRQLLTTEAGTALRVTVRTFKSEGKNIYNV